MVKYFANPEEAKLYTKCSNKPIKGICPECGNIKNNVIINNIYRTHSIGCSKCGDGFSYPSKTMWNVLQQLHINFKTEYNPDWCKYILNNEEKQGKYDFYLEINKNIKKYKYIIEMDGEWHDKDNNLSGQTREESKFIDDEKDRLADEYGIEVIRIDCNYRNKNRFKLIKDNILSSKLAKLFDLSNINWLEVEEFALNSLIKKTCELKQKNPKLTKKDLSKIIGVDPNTINTYLKQGKELFHLSDSLLNKKIKVNK